MAKKKRISFSQKPLIRRESVQMPEEHYSGDKPNPALRSFVEEHQNDNPYNVESDNYNISGFNKPIDSTKATAIYNLHSYWSKKPHGAILQYIRHYTKPSDLVLDPFCGSGGTALAALIEKRKAIAIDRSPAATFITKNYCTPVIIDKLRREFNELEKKVKPEIDWLFETRCDRCDGKAMTAYTVYSHVFQCPRCMEKFPFFDCVETKIQDVNSKLRTINVCPYCYTRGNIEEIKTRGRKFEAVPVLVSYKCKSGCKPVRGERRHNDSSDLKRKYFNNYDLKRIKEIEGKEIPYWYPKLRMMHAPEDQECWGVKWRAGTSNFRTVDELFTKRNLWSLALIRHYINTDNHLLLAFNSVLLNSSKLYRHRTGGGGGSAGNYYIAQNHREMAVWPQFLEKIQSYLDSDWSCSNQIMISTQTATNLLEIAPSSVDYIFTDPPYADKVQYGELNFIWEAWLGFDTHWHDEEIIVNEVRGTTEVDWAEMMRLAMAECYRVLKPGRWLSLCYHDTSEGTWSLIQDIMAEVGFLVDKSDSALFIDTQQKSYNQVVADKVNKRDLVINFRKPKPGESIQFSLTGYEDETTFNDKVRFIIREYLISHPGTTKDRIYDEVVSRMVRTGRMEAHNFDELLTHVAEPAQTEGRGGNRWYLKESEMDKTDRAETVKEDAAAEKLRAFMVDFLKANPSQEGVHYSDLFEQYVYTVRDKPRRSLIDWLSDYFYKTEDGTYRPPLSDDEVRIKAEGREKGLQRRIKRYLAYIEQGVAIPDNQRPNAALLAEWIRHCKRSGLFSQGKTLFEKGGLKLDNLDEETMVNIEEDYQVCVRMQGRSVVTNKKTKKRKRVARPEKRLEAFK